MDSGFGKSRVDPHRRTARRILYQCLNPLRRALYAVLETVRPIVVLALGAIALALLVLALLNAALFHARHFPMAFVLTTLVVAVGGIVVYDTITGWMSARSR